MADIFVKIQTAMNDALARTVDLVIRVVQEQPLTVLIGVCLFLAFKQVFQILHCIDLEYIYYNADPELTAYERIKERANRKHIKKHILLAYLYTALVFWLTLVIIYLERFNVRSV